jgi:hypothetical protein
MRNEVMEKSIVFTPMSSTYFCGGINRIFMG